MESTPANIATTLHARSDPGLSGSEEYVLNSQLQAAIVLGFTLGFGLLTVAKAVSQTRQVYRKSGKSGNVYIRLVWILLVACLIGSLLVFFGIYGTIKPSLAYYFFVLCTWIPQYIITPNLIINRIALLLYSQREIRLLKWTVTTILTLFCISVFIVWIPARLEVSPTYVHFNNVWDRLEKAVYLLVDGSLNALFIHLVRTKLLAFGLDRYRPLFKFNLLMIAVSISLDIVLIGMMSLPNGFVYAQFHPLVFVVKANIEMSNAALIIKIVRSSQEANGTLPPSSTTASTSTAHDENQVSEQQQQQQQGCRGRWLQRLTGRRSGSKSCVETSPGSERHVKASNEQASTVDIAIDDGPVWNGSMIKRQAEEFIAERGGFESDEQDVTEFARHHDLEKQAC